MGLEGQTMIKMKALTDTEMQYLTGGDDPVDPNFPPPYPLTGILQIQLQWLLDSLGKQQQAALLRWLRTQGS